jgi:ketosteroid isomerase-like protein
MQMRFGIGVIAVVVLCSACRTPAQHAATSSADQAAHEAHQAYVTAINSNKTHWDKPIQEFIVNGDWAFERYSYASNDTPLAGGNPVTDTGWGLVIYHHDPDGKWRVARDAWGPDHPAN